MKRHSSTSYGHFSKDFAGAFAERGHNGDLAGLRSAVDTFVEATEQGSREVLMDSKTHFYKRLTDGAEDVFFKPTLMLPHNRITLLRMTSVTHARQPVQSIWELSKMDEAIAARDAKRLKAACRTHVEHAALVALAEQKGEPG